MEELHYTRVYLINNNSSSNNLPCYAVHAVLLLH